jgi:streptogramin lyase
MAYNGRMYWGSGDQTTFLEYDPATDTCTTFGSVTAGAYRGVVYHPNGYLYAMGANNGTIVRIDPKTRTVTTMLTGQTSAFYVSGCVGADGQIFFVGQTTTTTVYNVYTNQASTLSMPAGQWQGVVMRGNGDLICSPWGSGQFVKIPIVKNREYFLANGQNGGGLFGRHVTTVG